MQIQTEHVTGADHEAIAAKLRTLRAYQQVLHESVVDTRYERPEAALAAAGDHEVIASAQAIAAKYGEKLRTVLLVGIGGSDLGTRAVYEALRGHTGHLKHGGVPRLITLSTIEPDLLERARDVLRDHYDPQEIVLVVVTKSGTTTEAVVNANILFEMMRAQFGERAAVRQTVLVSTEDAPLVATAQAAGVTHVAMPKTVGGRYSVCTAVGLVPLALVGIDVRAFTDGAFRGARAAAPESGVSPAALLAAHLACAYEQGLRMHELFVWHPGLETLGKWYRQLLAESIGKKNASGEPVGITPTVAVGSDDLHSHGQLVFSGPATRFTTHVVVPSMWEGGLTVDSSSPFVLPMLANKETGTVMRAIYDGVLTTYRAHELPYITVELDALTERELGAFMSVHMASVMYLAQLLDVNAFDQPDVEHYKTETKRLLDSTT